MARSKSSKTSDETETDTAKARDSEEAVTETVQSEGEIGSDAGVDDAEVVEDTVEETVEEPGDETDPQEPLAAETPRLQNEPARQAVFLPMLLGGIAAGGIGFAAATFMERNGQQQIDVAAELATRDTQIEALKAQIDASQAALNEASERLESLQAAEVVTPEALSNSIEQIQSKIGDQLAAIDGRLSEVEKRPSGEATGVDAAALAAYQRDLDAVRGEVQDLSSSLEDMAAAAEARMENARAEAEALRAEAEAAARAATAKSALAAIATEIESGGPFEDALDRLAEAGGVQIPDALASVAANGVASRQGLLNDYAPAARAALAAARSESTGGSASERLQGFLQAQLGARSLEPREGDDPDAVLSRMEAAVRNGDLGLALQEMSALPDSAKSELANWARAATDRMSAKDALKQLSDALE